ncbi:MAG: phosphate ABC transporter substrate-binding protein [Clostridiaceae bacterium]|nr:phosphate ABC transporter substrate-binding protein [Clostridiaceae bacterium]
MVKKILALVILVAVVFTFSACQNDNKPETNPYDNSNKNENVSDDTEVSGPVLSGKLLIEGSTSMQKIFQELIDTYTAKNPKVTIEYIGDGSSAGIKAAIDGTANIGTSSREVKAEELSQGIEVIKIAEDAIAVIVNNQNQVGNLTREQIAKIYKKEITNWKEVGGADAPIVVVARDAASGTREAFETLFDVTEQVKADQEAAKTGEVKTIISQNPNAIGYISLAYTDNTVKALAIDGVQAEVDNVINGTYTVKRPFNIVTKGKPDALEQAFIDFIFSDEGKEIISKEAIPVEK